MARAGALVVLAAMASLVRAQDAPPPVIVSPEIREGGRVTLRLWAPRAGEVLLSGDWMGRQPPVALARDEQGTWTTTVGPLEPNLYTYGFIVDGVRASDPACRCSLTGAGRFSSSRFVVKGPAAAPWEERNVARGTLHDETFFSARLQRSSRFLVYTPAAYRRGAARYPVLILLPGTPGVASDWTTGGGEADVMFDNLIADGKMMPMIVVMHASDVLRNGKRADNLAAFEPLLLGELLPEIQARYRAARRPAEWAIAGVSLGGEFALTVGLRHPEAFRTVAALGGSLVEQDFEDRFGKALADPAKTRRDYRLIWFSCGADDVFSGGNRTLAAKLAAAGVPHTFREVAGGHTAPVFRRQLAELLPLLFR